MCHTSYTGLFYQITIHNYSHQKHHFLHSLELSKCSPTKDTIREATTNGFPPYEDFHDLGDWCYLVPLPVHTIDALLRFSQLEETTQSIPGVSTRMIHQFAQSFNPSKLQRNPNPSHMLSFFQPSSKSPRLPNHQREEQGRGWLFFAHLVPLQSCSCTTQMVENPIQGKN